MTMNGLNDLMGRGSLAALRSAWDISIRERGLRRLLATVLFLVLVVPPQVAAAQVRDGATMTVLRGEVAVIRPDGSGTQPAPSGTTVFVGDEIRTLTPAGALITFFAGTEVELSSGTIMVVEQISRDGDRIEVSLKQVLGATLNRVQSLSDPGSSYRVDAGGAVAVFRQ